MKYRSGRAQGHLRPFPLFFRAKNEDATSSTTNTDGRGVSMKISSELLRRQSTQYSCGPASLSIALRCLGLRYSERWLSKYMGTKPVTGTAPSAFRIVLRRLGLKFFETENAGVYDLTEFVGRGFSVIVAWDFQGDGHYSVVTSLTAHEVYMIDPFFGKLEKMRIRKFVKLWRDPCNHTERWMFALYPSRGNSPQPEIDQGFHNKCHLAKPETHPLLLRKKIAQTRKMSHAIISRKFK